MVQLEKSQMHHYLNKISFQYLISTSVLSMIQLYPWDSPYKRGTLKDTVLQKFTKVSHGGKCYNINAGYIHGSIIKRFQLVWIQRD